MNKKALNDCSFLTIAEAIVKLSLKLAEAFHFKRIDLLPATLLLFSQHGYNCWTSHDGGGIAETSESDWDAIGVPRGEQQKLKRSLELYHKDFNAYNQFLVGNFSKFKKRGPWTQISFHQKTVGTASLTGALTS